MGVIPEASNTVEAGRRHADRKLSSHFRGGNLKRFKAAALTIAQARDERAVERAMRHFLASLRREERAVLETMLGRPLHAESEEFATTADDLTRLQRQFAGRNADRAIVVETAQVYIVASNRLYQFGRD